MNPKGLVQYVKGYVDIVIEGYYIERFINICNTKRILLWNLKRDDAITLHASIDIRNFKRLRNLCKKTKCRARIVRKKGFPFKIKKYKKRKIFLIALIILLFSLFCLTKFIWNIEVEGTQNISKEEIKGIAENEGLAIGKLKNSIDIKQVINKIRLERDDIAWIGIDIEGTNAIIKVVEADKKPEIINEEDYCNIVADKDAIITKVTARNGTTMVKDGDVVKKGDILIAGWLEGKYTGKQYVHSQGEIQAKVWYKVTEKVNLKEIKKVETNNMENRYSLKINNFQINLNKSIPKFEKYDTIETSKKLKLFSNFYLPIELITYSYVEYQEENIVHSIEEAKSIAVDRGKEKLENELKDKKILDTQIKIKSEKDYIEVEMIYEVEETIGIKETIVF